MAKKPNVQIRNPRRGVPSGYIVGRSAKGVGPAELLTPDKIARAIAASGAIPASNGGLANTGVIPGSYMNTNLTVNAQGQLTAASNGSPGGYMLPLVTGETPGPTFITDDIGQCIGVPL